VRRGLKSLGGLRAPALPLRFGTMRDLDTIDSELRLLVAVRWSIREHGGEPSSRQVDKLLDERLAHRGPGPASTPQSAPSGAPSLVQRQLLDVSL
jgi:hypothetical protein